MTVQELIEKLQNLRRPHMDIYVNTYDINGQLENEILELGSNDIGTAIEIRLK